MILYGRGKQIMMYNPQLETFLCVVEAGSFSKAAEKLYISAPAVIKQINSLEKSLDLKLFERSYRGLKVTPAGEAIYQDAKYIINYCKESVERAKEAMDKKEEVIRVGISPLTPPQVFVELWPKIQKYDKEMKFKLITFENTPENAREILANLGQNIDVIAGVFDDTMLKLRQCQGIEISKEQFCVAVSMHHKLASKDHLEIEDLYGENLMIIKEGWGKYADILREELSKNHQQIYLKDFDFYSVDVFNQCENSDDMLLAFKAWESVHPLMKIIPVNWDYGMPFGLLYSRHPEQKVEKLLKAIKQIKKEDL